MGMGDAQVEELDLLLDCLGKSQSSSVTHAVQDLSVKSSCSPAGPAGVRRGNPRVEQTFDREPMFDRPSMPSGRVPSWPIDSRQAGIPVTDRRTARHHGARGRLRLRQSSPGGWMELRRSSAPSTYMHAD
jgi:hypothetical protein